MIQGIEKAASVIKSAIDPQQEGIDKLTQKLMTAIGAVGGGAHGLVTGAGPGLMTGSPLAALTTAGIGGATGALSGGLIGRSLAAKAPASVAADARTMYDIRQKRERTLADSKRTMADMAASNNAIAAETRAFNTDTEKHLNTLRAAKIKELQALPRAPQKGFLGL